MLLREEYRGMLFTYDSQSSRAAHVETGLTLTFAGEDARLGVSEMYFFVKWGDVEQKVTAGYETGLHKIMERLPDMSGRDQRALRKEMSEKTFHLCLLPEVESQLIEVPDVDMGEVFVKTLRYLIHKADLAPLSKRVNIDYFMHPLSESIIEELAERVERQRRLQK